MEAREMEALVAQLRAAGLDDEQIMEAFYETFQNGKMDRDDLSACAEFMGYELTDEFASDGRPDPSASATTDGITEEEAEAAKEDPTSVMGGAPKGGEEPGEAPKRMFQKPGEAPDGDEPGEDDDEAGWEEAQRRFKW